MNGTVAPPSSNSTAAATCPGATPSSVAMRWPIVRAASAGDALITEPHYSSGNAVRRVIVPSTLPSVAPARGAGSVPRSPLDATGTIGTHTPEDGMNANRNEYLDQAVAQQERLEQDLRSKRAAPPMPAAASAPAPQSR